MKNGPAWTLTKAHSSWLTKKNSICFCAFDLDAFSELSFATRSRRPTPVRWQGMSPWLRPSPASQRQGCKRNAQRYFSFNPFRIERFLLMLLLGGAGASGKQRVATALRGVPTAASRAQQRGGLRYGLRGVACLRFTTLQLVHTLEIIKVYFSILAPTTATT